jgi:DNA-binding transcriptional regulator GbsR (MarR family)
MRTAKKEFENLVYQSIKSQGLDELSSKLIGILYSESDLMTLEELSEKTNYSFSAVSAAMKLLTSMHIVETTKKGGSKKLYFSIQRDMVKMTLIQVKSKNELMVAPAIKKLPSIIQMCKKSKAEGSEEMLQILEQYYQQMITLDKIMKQLVEFTKKFQKEVNTNE